MTLCFRRQVLSYPQKSWKKKRYQYLKFFLQPRRSLYDPESEMHVISQIENPSLSGMHHAGSGMGNNGEGEGLMGQGLLGKDDAKNPVRERGAQVGLGVRRPLTLLVLLQSEWSFYEDEMFEDEEKHHENSDSDYDYEDYSSKKKKGKSKGGKAKGVRSSSLYVVNSTRLMES